MNSAVIADYKAPLFIEVSVKFSDLFEAFKTSDQSVSTVDIVVCAEGLKLDSWACQIGHRYLVHVYNR